MKRNMILILILAAVLGTSISSYAKTKIAEGSLGTLSAEGDVTLRYENWSWFEAAGSTKNSSYDYYFARTSLGILFENQSFRTYVQAQDVHMFGLPENSVDSKPQGPLGIGSIYYLHNQNDNPHSLIIRQAYIEFPELFSGLISARAGRFDYIDATEVMYKNPKVNTIKNIRLAERLIGPFGWSSFRRSFDGFQFAYDNEKINIHSVMVHPTQGGFENNAHNTISDIDLITLTSTMKYDKVIPDTEMRFFYYYYRDDRNISETPGQSGLDQGAIRVNTYGAHWLRLWKTEGGIFDAVFWGAYQDGDWGNVAHEAWAFDIEAGYQFMNIPGKPWLRAGYYKSSGDSNTSGGRHKTFYQLLPTARKYALYPFYNMMNNQDLFLQGIVKPVKNLTLRADLHFLTLAEKNDLWYMGAGPTIEQGGIFGYIGRPGTDSNDLGTVFDLVASYAFNKHLKGTAYYGHVFGDDVIKNIYPGGEDADYFYIEMAVSF